MQGQELINILTDTYLPRFGEILLAGVIGGLIGFEREHHGQAAGLRTNMIVSLGACLLMQLSLHIESIHRYLDADSVVRLDPTRIASYAIASMGFLGAGAIIKGKGSVRGLTTAASLWFVTGIGLCVGAGVIFPAIVVALIIMAILYLFPLIMKNLIKRNSYIKLSLEFSTSSILLNDIKEILEAESNVTVQPSGYQRQIQDDKVIFTFNLIGKEDTCWQKISQDLMVLKGLRKVSFEEAEVP